VHLTLYEPQRHVYAVCSCCACCCHDLQFLMRYGRADLVAHSEYVAATDADACTHCGDCIARCPFGARAWEGSEMRYDPATCFGCGLCVTTCPAGATTLQRRG
jgi:heterodisulfide reductase subunit A-like polyferredoxin